MSTVLDLASADFAAPAPKAAPKLSRKAAFAERLSAPGALEGIVALGQRAAARGRPAAGGEAAAMLSLFGDVARWAEEEVGPSPGEEFCLAQFVAETQACGNGKLVKARVAELREMEFRGVVGDWEPLEKRKRRMKRDERERRERGDVSEGEGEREDEDDGESGEGVLEIAGAPGRETVQERIERNRRMAMERRLAAQGKAVVSGGAVSASGGVDGAGEAAPAEPSHIGKLGAGSADVGNAGGDPVGASAAGAEPVLPEGAVLAEDGVDMYDVMMGEGDDDDIDMDLLADME